MVDLALVRDALSRPLVSTHFDALGRRYEGKVRDNYTTDDGRRFLVTTDRVSAFDRVLGTLPLKGQILQWVASYWFSETAHIADNHVIAVRDPNVVEAHECTPLGAEFVVRAYLTGVTKTSIWTHYAAGARVFCGHRLPEGLRKNEPLPEPILTPSTKAQHGDHDVSVSGAELVARGDVTASDFEEAAAMALALFRFGQEHCRRHGLVLVDTKYELGRDREGRLRVIDEIHTPDSSRYWFAASYEERMRDGLEPESFDKEYLRRYLSAQGFTGDGPIPPIPDDVKVESSRRYIEACEAVTGKPFVPDLAEPIARIRQNLGL